MEKDICIICPQSGKKQWKQITQVKSLLWAQDTWLASSDTLSKGKGHIPGPKSFKDHLVMDEEGDTWGSRHCSSFGPMLIPQQGVVYIYRGCLLCSWKEMGVLAVPFKQWKNTYSEFFCWVLSAEPYKTQVFGKARTNTAGRSHPSGYGCVLHSSI